MEMGCHNFSMRKKKYCCIDGIIIIHAIQRNAFMLSGIVFTLDKGFGGIENLVNRCIKPGSLSDLFCLMPILIFFSAKIEIPLGPNPHPNN